MENHRLRTVLLVFGALVCIAALAALYWLLRAPSPSGEDLLESVTAPANAPPASLESEQLQDISAPASKESPAANENLLPSLSAPQ